MLFIDSRYNYYFGIGILWGMGIVRHTGRCTVDAVMGEKRATSWGSLCEQDPVVERVASDSKVDGLFVVFRILMIAIRKGHESGKNVSDSTITLVEVGSSSW